jgi:hypothetical protein
MKPGHCLHPSGTIQFGVENRERSRLNHDRGAREEPRASRWAVFLRNGQDPRKTRAGDLIRASCFSLKVRRLTVQPRQ